MKKNLFLTLTIWLAGASSALAQGWGHHPVAAYPPHGAYPGAYTAAPAPPARFPTFNAPGAQPGYGLEPYPVPILPAGGVAMPPAFAAPLPSAAEFGPDPQLPVPWDPSKEMLPVVTFPPASGATSAGEKPFLPPPPTDADGVPRALPNAGPDAPPEAMALPAEACMGSDCFPGILLPGEPVIAQLIEGHPLSKGHTWYFSADYLRWWTRDQAEVPALLGPLGMPAAGLRADPDNDERSGARFHLGRWVDGMRCWALEADFLFLGKRSPRSTLAVGPIDVVRLPFFAGIEGIDRRIEYGSRFWQKELGLRYKALAGPHWRIDLLGGSRYFELDEHVEIATSTAFSRAPVLLSDAAVTTTDRFVARNRFIGGQVGVDAEVVHGSFFLQTSAKIAVGNNRQRVNVTGETRVEAPPQPLGDLILPGMGAFVTPENSGTFSRNRLAFVPEFAVYTGVRLHDCVRLGLGYNFLFISDVARPADQIDPTAGQSLPLSFLGPPFTPANPTFPFASSTFWAQGISVRLELRY